MRGRIVPKGTGTPVGTGRLLPKGATPAPDFKRRSRGNRYAAGSPGATFINSLKT